MYIRVFFSLIVFLCFPLFYVGQTVSKPADGSYTEYYEDGVTVRCTGNYLNALKEGTWVDWSRDGKVEMLVNYQNGKRNGYFALCYYGGKLKREGVMCNDMECGLVYEYDADGKLLSKSCAVNGSAELRKVTTYFPDNGKTESEHFTRNGVKDSVSRSFWESGKLKREISFSGGIQTGDAISFSEAGDTLEYKNIKTGISIKYIQEKLPEHYYNEYKSAYVSLKRIKKEVPSETESKSSSSGYYDKYSDDSYNYKSTYDASYYYQNGKLAYKKKYVKGKKEGEYLVQDSSGQRMYFCTYAHGKKDGREEKYFRNGKLAEEKNYVDGKLSGKMTRYNEKGIVMESGEYRNDYRNGNFAYFTADGKPEKLYVYKNDVLVEEYRYSSSGKKEKVDLYKPKKKQYEDVVIQEAVLDMDLAVEAPVENGVSGGQDNIVSIAEEMPEFPGGESAMKEFLIRNIKYPSMAKDNGIQGRCWVEFVVEKDGSITGVTVKRGISGGPDCDKEAVRVIKSFPNWKPGKQNGKPVRVSYVVPVQFKLN